MYAILLFYEKKSLPGEGDLFWMGKTLKPLRTRFALLKTLRVEKAEEGGGRKIIPRKGGVPAKTILLLPERGDRRGRPRCSGHRGSSAQDFSFEISMTEPFEKGKKHHKN